MKRVYKTSLSATSIDQTIRALREYKKHLMWDTIEKIEEGCITAFIEAANEAYHSKSTKLSYEKLERGRYLITIQGSQVGFLEFGAGWYADEAHEYANAVPFKVYRGSWSEDHANTYKEFINDPGNDPEDYPYNRMPRYGIVAGMEAARKYLQKVRKEGVV